MSRLQGRHARWLGLVGDLLRDPLTELPTDVIARELTETFRATGSCWTRRDADGGGETRPWPPEIFPPEALGHIRLCLGDRQPLVHWYDVTGSRAPQTLGRVPRAIADDTSVAAWRELSTPLGIEHQLLIPLHVQDKNMQVFVSARPDTDFSDEDLELAALIQAILVGLNNQAMILRRWQTCVDGALSAQPTPTVRDIGLTGREMAVLALLGEGLATPAIARQLRISPRTVGKHQEHIYTKLGTHDRLSTVLEAQRRQLLPAGRRASATQDSHLHPRE